MLSLRGTEFVLLSLLCRAGLVEFVEYCAEFVLLSLLFRACLAEYVLLSSFNGVRLADRVCCAEHSEDSNHDSKEIA